MYKAFIVDDEQMIVKGLTKLIHWEELGFEVIGTAFNGTTAFRSITDLKPDVVISDIQLGDTTGLKLINQVLQVHPDTLFIFISGYDDFKYCQEAIHLGAVDNLLKPVDMNYLEGILSKCSVKLKDMAILNQTDRISFNTVNSSDSKVKDSRLIDDIKDYIDANYMENIDIASIAARFYIGQTYFSELFKKEYKVNFKKYLTRLRMEKAKLYILGSDYKISDIAAKVGYEDPGYFSQVFKNHTGKTPRQFKNQSEGEPH